MTRSNRPRSEAVVPPNLASKDQVSTSASVKTDAVDYSLAPVAIRHAIASGAHDKYMSGLSRRDAPPHGSQAPPPVVARHTKPHTTP